MLQGHDSIKDSGVVALQTYPELLEARSCAQKKAKIASIKLRFARQLSCGSFVDSCILDFTCTHTAKPNTL
jgi:hypothetical protein